MQGFFMPTGGSLAHFPEPPGIITIVLSLSGKPAMPQISRSVLTSLIAGLISSSLCAQPVLHKVTSGDGTIYILGGTEVPDDSWVDARVRDALADSSTLWVEIPPTDPAAGVPTLREEVVPGAGAEMHPVAIEEGYGNMALGDYFDVVMGERSVIESQRLPLAGVNVRAMQPWLAWYTFSFAFWDQQDLNLVDPADTLVTLARKQDKEVRSLFANRADFYRFMGRMSDFAETHYFQTLYNTMDWQRSGEYESRYNWMHGEPDDRYIERFRTQTPDYYRYMFQRRNPAIAEQLAGMLVEGGSHFLYVDVNRLLGADSLLVALEGLGLSVEEI